MKNQPSTAMIVAAAVVAGLCITSVTLIIITVDKTELPEGWLGLFLGFLSALLVAVVGLAKIDKIEGHVVDLTNGKMDAKIRAGVAEVLANHLIDPAMTAQLIADRERRDEHGEQS